MQCWSNSAIALLQAPTLQRVSRGWPNFLLSGAPCSAGWWLMLIWWLIRQTNRAHLSVGPPFLFPSTTSSCSDTSSLPYSLPPPPLISLRCARAPLLADPSGRCFPTPASFPFPTPLTTCSLWCSSWTL